MKRLELSSPEPEVIPINTRGDTNELEEMESDRFQSKQALCRYLLAGNSILNFLLKY